MLPKRSNPLTIFFFRAAAIFYSTPSLRIKITLTLIPTEQIVSKLTTPQEIRCCWDLSTVDRVDCPKSSIADQTHLELVSGKLVLQKKLITPSNERMPQPKAHSYNGSNTCKQTYGSLVMHHRSTCKSGSGSYQLLHEAVTVSDKVEFMNPALTYGLNQFS